MFADNCVTLHRNPKHSGALLGSNSVRNRVGVGHSDVIWLLVGKQVRKVELDAVQACAEPLVRIVALTCAPGLRLLIDGVTPFRFPT